MNVMNASEYTDFIKNYYGEDSSAYQGLGWKKFNADGTPDYSAGTYDTVSTTSAFFFFFIIYKLPIPVSPPTSYVPVCRFENHRIKSPQPCQDPVHFLLSNIILQPQSASISQNSQNSVYQYLYYTCLSEHYNNLFLKNL